MSGVSPSSLIAALVAAALVGPLACGGDDDEAAGESAFAQAIARTRPAWTPEQEPTRPLSGSGPHAMTLRAELRLDAPAGTQRLEITRVVQRGPGHAYTLLDRRAWTTPSVHADNPPRTHVEEVASRFDGARFAGRRGDGPWLERDTLDGHAERVLAAAYDLQTLVLGGLGDYLAWRDLPPNEERPATVAGLPVTWREASLDTAVRPRVMNDAELRALREHTRDWTAWVGATHQPTRVSGRVAFTEAGLVALGELELVGVARVDGVEAPFLVRLSVNVDKLDPKASFTLPADALPATRPRPWKMIEDVLGDDLSPVYRPR